MTYCHGVRVVTYHVVELSFLTQDVTECMTMEEMVDQFNLFKLCCNRCWHIQACDACTGAGLFDGLEWLSHQLVGAQV